MKKYLIPIICFAFILVLFFTQYVFSAPVSNIFRSLIPESDNSYFVGTSSPKLYWANVYTRILTVSDGTATTTLSAGDVLATFAYPFTGVNSFLNATTSGLRMASSSVLGSFNAGTITATSGTSYIQALSIGTTLNVTGTSTLAGLSAGFGTFSENLVASKLLNVTGVATFAASIIASGGMTLTCTDCITDTNVSDTLTASDLVAGSSVVSNTEVDNDLTISGGVIDNSIIGGTTAAAGTFTNLTITASSTINRLWVGLNGATTTSLAVTGRMSYPVASTTGATAITINANNGKHQRIILEGNSTIIMNSTSSSPTDGTVVILHIHQDSTGSRTVEFSSKRHFWTDGNGATTSINQTANSCTNVGFIYHSRFTMWEGMASTTRSTCPREAQ